MFQSGDDPQFVRAVSEAVLEVATDGVHILTVDGEVVQANPAFCRMLGYSHREMLRMRASQWDAQWDQREIGLKIAELTTPKVFETWHRRKDGSVFPVEISAGTFELGGRTLVVASARDITSRKQIEAELRDSERRFLGFLDRAPIGVFFQVEGQFQFVNAVALAAFGASSASDLAGTPVLDRFHPAFHIVIGDRIRRARVESLPSPRLQQIWLRMDGSEFDVESTSMPFSLDGRSGVLVVFADITAQKRAQVQLDNLQTQYQHVEKMESVGRLAGGIAHDFNNLLTVINGFAEIVCGETARESPAHRAGKRILDSGQRAAALTRQLLSFARQNPVVQAVQDVNYMIDSNADLLRQVVGEDATLDLDLVRARCVVQIDEGEFNQVLMNLIVNARDAIARTGRVLISTSLYSRPAPGKSPAGPTDCVRLSVSDTGCGMKPELVARIFDPFFTTKAPDQGTGLGLSIVYAIVRRAAGFIEVDSRVGLGTTFHIDLPLVPSEAPLLPAQKERTPVQTKPLTIMVVEDQPEVSDLVARILKADGHTVYTVLRPVDAMRIAGDIGRFDLMICDVVMPQLNGPQLVAQMQQRGIEFRVLFVSGHSAHALLRTKGIHVHGPLLQKPFSIGDLRAAVASVMG